MGVIYESMLGHINIKVDTRSSDYSSCEALSMLGTWGEGFIG